MEDGFLWSPTLPQTSRESQVEVHAAEVLSDGSCLVSATHSQEPCVLTLAHARPL